MSLFRQLDKESTKRNVKRILTTYRLLRQLAGEEFIPKVTVTYSFEPRSSSFNSSSAIEKHVVRQVTAQQKMIEIEQAINKLTAYDRQVLFEKYCGKEQLDVAIYMSLNLSETEFYRQLDKALFAFAEVYRHGELLVFADGKDINEFLGVN